jgi:hypothetical protein
MQDGAGIEVFSYPLVKTGPYSERRMDASCIAVLGERGGRDLIRTTVLEAVHR